MVFCYQNCSDRLRKNCSSDREKIVLVIEKNFANFESTRTICSNSERSEQFLIQNVFLTCSWKFLRHNKLEQLEFKLEQIEFKLEKNIGI